MNKNTEKIKQCLVMAGICTACGFVAFVLSMIPSPLAWFVTLNLVMWVAHTTLATGFGIKAAYLYIDGQPTLAT